MVRTFTFAVMASLALASAAFAQTCPLNFISPIHSGIVAAVRRDSSCSSPSFCTWKSRWDNTVGSARIDVLDPGCSSEAGSSTNIQQTTQDDYVITGPAGPVSFQVFLHVLGSGTQTCRTIFIPGQGFVTQCSTGTVAASLTDGTVTTSVPAATSLNTTLVLSLTKTVGQHWPLGHTLSGNTFCGNSANISSQVELVLPPGYGLTSCYGYTISSPVPALQTSWGKVKTLYR